MGYKRPIGLITWWYGMGKTYSTKIDSLWYHFISREDYYKCYKYHASCLQDYEYLKEESREIYVTGENNKESLNKKWYNYDVCIMDDYGTLIPMSAERICVFYNYRMVHDCQLESNRSYMEHSYPGNKAWITWTLADD